MKTVYSMMLAITFLFISNHTQAKTIEMEVNGLVCAFCAQGIEKTMRNNPATQDVVVSLKDKLVAIELKAGKDIDDTQLKKSITDAGYTLVKITRSETAIADIRKRVQP
jgi:copper chaperone CopZ